MRNEAISIGLFSLNGNIRREFVVFFFNKNNRPFFNY